MPKNNISTSDPLSKYAIASDGNLQPVANCDQLQISDIDTMQVFDSYPLRFGKLK